MLIGNPYFYNYLKCKWAEFTNKEAQSDRLDLKEGPKMCCLQETYLSHKNKGRFKEKGWKIILQANNIHRKSGVDILISDKIYFKITKVTRDRQEMDIL